MLERPSPRIVSDFERIKRIPVPYEEIDEGIRDLCAAINALPYAITTERSEDTREFTAKVPSDDGFTLLKQGHISIAFDEHDQRSYAFIKKVIDLVSQFPDIELMPKPVADQEGHPPGWARDDIDDILVSEIGYKIRVKNDRQINPSDQIQRLRKVLSQSAENTPADDLQRRVDEVLIRSQQIPKEEAERKISQFNEFKQKLTQLALEADVVIVKDLPVPMLLGNNNFFDTFDVRFERNRQYFYIRRANP